MVIVLQGGVSAEREVSFWTASSVCHSLRRIGRDYVEVDAADADWLDQVVKLQPEAVIIALHGPFGEDGKVQKALEEAGIKYTGSDSAVAALTIDKARTIEAVLGMNVTVPVSVVGKKGESIVWDKAYPVVVKPNGDGSSFGVTLVTEPEKLQEACEEAFRYGDTLLVEEYIKGTELTCGVLDLFGEVKALPLVEIRPHATFFNFETKYTTSECLEICPAPIDEKITLLIQEKSVQIFKELKTRQYSRLDWILRGDTPYFLEINTLPGMTSTSLIIKELAAAGIAYDEFLTKLIETA